MSDEQTLDYTVHSHAWPDLEKRRDTIEEIMICGERGGEYAIRWIDLGQHGGVHHIGLRFEIYSDGMDIFMSKTNMELVWRVKERSRGRTTKNELTPAEVVQICREVGIEPSVYEQRHVTDRAEADAERRVN